MNMDEWLENRAKRYFAMQRLTNDFVLHRYWEFIEEHTKNGFLPFVIKGAAAWKSDPGVRIKSPDGKIWLESRYDELDIKKAMSSSHEIWGGRSIALDISNIEDSRARLEEALEEIALVSNSFSLATGASLNWFPARQLDVQVRTGDHEEPAINQPIENRKILMHFALSRHSEEQTSTIIDDTGVTKDIFGLIHHIRLISNSRACKTIKTAIGWHAQAGIIPSGLNRFLNYWSSIELICHSFYESLPDIQVGKLSKAERDAKLAKLMTEPISPSKRTHIIRSCYELINPTARTKMANIFKLLYPADEGNRMRKALFDKDPATKKSMIDIRNDIAHGNYSEFDREFVSLVEHRLPLISSLSQDVIVASVNRAKTLFSQP